MQLAARVPIALGQYIESLGAASAVAAVALLSELVYQGIHMVFPHEQTQLAAPQEQHHRLHPVPPGLVYKHQFLVHWIIVTSATSSWSRCSAILAVNVLT